MKYCLALNSHFGILQPISSSKPYILLSRNIMEGFMQHRGSETAKIIPFAYQRLPSTKQPSWNSSNIIIFQTIYPLEQKLDVTQQADRLHRQAEIIPLRSQRGQALNSHLRILQPTSSSKPYNLLSINLMGGSSNMDTPK